MAVRRWRGHPAPTGGAQSRAVLVALALAAGACCPGKVAEAPAAPPPSAEVAVAPATGTPAPAAPGGGPAVEPYRVVAPADATAPLSAWVEGVGCRLLAADEAEYACLEGGEADMGFTMVSLTVRSLADSREVASFDLYDGPMDFDAAKILPGLKEANAYLRKGAFTLRAPQAPPAATLSEGQLVVGEGRSPLPPMPTSAPTDALEAKVETCCRWQVEGVTAFADVDTVVVRLVRPCRFGRPDGEAPEACRDADYNPENHYEPGAYVSVKLP